MLAAPVNQRVIATVEGRVAELRADTLTASLPPQAWKEISAGAGAKGPRLYHWSRAVVRPGPHCASSSGWPTPAGRSRESFQPAKGEVGLEQYQVRRWQPSTATSPWRASRTPSLPPPAPPPGQKRGSAVSKASPEEMKYWHLCRAT